MAVGCLQEVLGVEVGVGEGHQEGGEGEGGRGWRHHLVHTSVRVLDMAMILGLPLQEGEEGGGGLQEGEEGEGGWECHLR